MRKLFVILVIGMGLTSCQSPTITHNPNIPTGELNVTNQWGSTSRLYVFRINGCEYIGKLGGGSSDLLCHMGNCHNPIHHYDEINK